MDKIINKMNHKTLNITTILTINLIFLPLLCPSRRTPKPEIPNDNHSNIKLLSPEDNIDSVSNFYDKMNSHANQEIVKLGFEKEFYTQMNTNKFYKNYEPNPYVNMHIYLKKEENEFKFAYEIFPEDPLAKMGTKKIQEIQNLTEEPLRKEFEFEIQGAVFTMLKMPKNIYGVNMKTGRNDCLGHNTFITKTGNEPKTSLHNDPDFVEIDFAHEKDAFENYINDTKNIYPMDSTSDRLEFAREFNDEFYLLIFCPFWLDVENPKIEARIEIDYIHDLPFYHGWFI
jgi:hypothetical protein